MFARDMQLLQVVISPVTSYVMTESSFSRVRTWFQELGNHSFQQIGILRENRLQLRMFVCLIGGTMAAAHNRSGLATLPSCSHAIVLL